MLGKGPMAERLGRGLQNLVQRFNSASDLKLYLAKNNGILIKNKVYICIPL